MKRFLAIIFLAGLMMTGCGNQAQNQPANQQKEEAKPAFEQAVEPVKDAANAAADTAKDATNAAVDTAKDATNAAVDTAKDAATAVVDTAASAIPDVPKPDMISSAPSIGSTREMFEAYADEQYVATYDDQGRVISMEINTPYIDNDMLAGILPSDVVITSFDSNGSDATKQVNHFQGTSAQLKIVNPASNGNFEAFTNFDKQTSQFLGGTISIK